MYSLRKSKAGNLVMFYIRKGYKKARYKKAEMRAWKDKPWDEEAAE